MAHAHASKRDPRVDVLRGLALIMIFLDHVPGNALNRYTMRNFGFSDAAEVFVLLAGFASMMAYGATFERQGAITGLRRIVARCLRLYVFQVGLLLTTLAIAWTWTQHFRMDPVSVHPMLNAGVGQIRRELTLRAQPPDLNILPLYIVLLSLFPVIYLGMHTRPRLTLALSGLLWASTRIWPSLNLTNAMDNSPWFFNPFAWQFLFTIGSCLAQATQRGPLPRPVWLIGLCWAYIVFACLEATAWPDYGLPNLRLVPIGPLDKTHLSLLRLLHVLAVVYLILTSAAVSAALRRPGLVAPLVRGIESCGKHSLEVFSLGTLLALVGRLLFQTYGTTGPMQVLVNGVGLVAMVGLGVLLERARARRKHAPATPLSAVHLENPGWGTTVH